MEVPIKVKIVGNENLKDVSDSIITPNDEMVVVVVGHIDSGLSFYGPFDDDELAEEFIQKVVHPALPAQWVYLTDPATLDDDSPAMCMSCGKEECNCKADVKEPIKLKVLKKPIEKNLPASETIFNEEGKEIGDQLVIA